MFDEVLSGWPVATIVVRLMDGTNRYRFEADPDAFAEWESARNTGGRSGGRAVGPNETPAVDDGKAVDNAA